MRLSFAFCAVLVCITTAVASSGKRVNLLYNATDPDKWTWQAEGDRHVYAWKDRSGPNGSASLNLRNSFFTETPCNLTYTYDGDIAFSDRYIPNNSVVYVGAWVKVSKDFKQTQPDSGLELWLHLSSPYNNEKYQSNSAANHSTSLTFGWNSGKSIPFNKLGTTWKYYEFPVNVGYSGWAGGWTNIRFNITSRMGSSGTLGAGFKGVIQIAKPSVYIKVSEPVQGKKVATFGNELLSISLDPQNNYALAEIKAEGVVFESGGHFPTFTAYDKNGNGFVFTPSDKGWTCNYSASNDKAEVIYSRNGLKVKVIYEIKGNNIYIKIQPLSETLYKLISVRDGGSFFASSAQNVFMLVPYAGGEVLTLEKVTHENGVSKIQDWWYIASFLAMAQDKGGLILRAPQYGATWSYGIKNINGKLSLVGGLEMFFRPGGKLGVAAPLIEPSLDLQLQYVKDVNKDGAFDWVDIGLAYRDSYIKKNENLDPKLTNSILGKIDVSAPYKNPQRYDTLINEIRQLAPITQTWWLVGAHTRPELSFCDPPYSSYPDPAWRGDYFKFKEQAAQVGARIGLHDMLQEIRSDMKDWPMPVRKRSDSADFMREWNSFTKSLGGEKFWKSIDNHFANWKVGKGESWHFDVLTAEPPLEDYNPAHWATRGMDVRDRIAMLKYIKTKLGIHITSEGLQEGMHEYCDFSWHARTADSEKGEFEGAKHVPLTPVLFLGNTYYALAFSIPKTLLYGARYVYEDTNLKVDLLKKGYTEQVVPWSKIANRKVTDIDKTENGWIVKYEPAATLTVDMVNDTYNLEIPDEQKTPADVKAADVK